MDLKGKKLLILGGAYQHRKIVQTAKKFGIETYVTDYLRLEISPAKQMADHQLMINVTDVDSLIQLCKDEKIDGVIAPYLDITQRPYQAICDAMGYPCFGTAEQHCILTDKIAFKKFCVDHDIDVIPTYSEESIYEDGIEYPILIKPSDSRGSRGQTICYNRQEAEKALDEAKLESISGNTIIEKYVANAQDIQLAYLVIHGEPILYKVEDRYLGEVEDGLDKVAIACVSPSWLEKLYRERFDERVKQMIRAIGLYNSPVFIQALYDGETFRLYDPGIRMPGDDYDDGHKLLTGIDIPELLVRFALTGEMPEDVAKTIRETRLHQYCAMILPCLKPGVISKIVGLNLVENNPHIVAMSHAYVEGDVVRIEKTVKQRYGEFVLVARDRAELSAVIEWLFNVFHVYDQDGEDMLIAKFDVSNMERYEW